MSDPSMLFRGFKPEHPLPQPQFVSDVSLLPSRGRRCFNPGLTQLPSSRMVMAYRHHSIADHEASRIALCELEAGQPVPGTSQCLQLPLPTGEEHHEDPRLFWHRDQLHLAYTEAYGYHGHWTCAMRLVRLKINESGKWEVGKVIPLTYGRNCVDREKNWQFFSQDGRLMFVYSLSPHVVVEINDEGQVLNEWSTPGISGWAHGTLSGGTPPVVVGDSYLSVLHSAQPHPRRTRRYNASAYRFERNPPFAIREVSMPFVVADETDGFSPEPKGTTDPCVVFPGGAISLPDGRLLLSIGVNDWRSALFVFDPCSVVYYSPDFPVVNRYFHAQLAALPVIIDREVRGTWSPVELVGDTWAGVMTTSDPNVINQLEEREDVREIDHQQYRTYLRSAVAQVPEVDRT